MINFMLFEFHWNFFFFKDVISPAEQVQKEVLADEHRGQASGAGPRAEGPPQPDFQEAEGPATTCALIQGEGLTSL